MRLLYTFDANVTRLIAGWPESWRSFFAFTTHLGDPIVTISIGLAIATAGYLQSHARLMIAGTVIWITLGVGSLLKLIFGRERPLTEYAANLRMDTFSFPSGHSSGAMVAYGLLAYIAWHMLPQPWGYIVAGLCVLVIIIVGISRVYLGAHFPSDVIAGWLLGVIGLAVIIYAVRPLA